MVHLRARVRWVDGETKCDVGRIHERSTDKIADSPVPRWGEIEQRIEEGYLLVYIDENG